MKILLFGKTGLLGQALFSVLKREHYVVATSRGECDITDKNAVKNAISKAKPDIAINVTGYTNVDKAEEEKPQAFLVNETGVKNIVEAVKPQNIPLLHFSTDYVFDGENPAGYKESDAPAPISAYGASKLAGEKTISETLNHYYIVRTSWLYGHGGNNFVATMLKLAQKKEPIKVVNDQIGSPTYTNDLAQTIAKFLIKKPEYGIYHLTNSGSCSWHEFAGEIFYQLGVPREIIPITSNQLGRPAKRPKCSILINTKFDKLRSWREALKDFLTDKVLIL